MQDPNAAAAQLAEHLSMLRVVPLQPCPPALAANHAGWIALQLQATAELVALSGLDPSVFPPHLRPAQLYLEAFHAASTRRRLFKNTDHDNVESSFTSSSDGSPALPRIGKVEPGQYVGQLIINGNSNPSDKDVELWVESGEVDAASLGSHGCLGLLRSARDAALAAAAMPLSPQQATGGGGTTSPTVEVLNYARSRKTLATVDALLGEELLNIGDIIGAKAALSEAAEQYRRDGWPGPLWRVLLLLRGCAAKEEDRASHVTLSLEASAQHGAAQEDQRRAIAQAAVEELQQLDATFIADTVDAPWAGILPVSAGFSPSFLPEIPASPTAAATATSTY